jgi:hypothetical protein
MPLNRKRPPVSIQVPDVPAAAYGISACGTFSEGNLEISRSGMRIAGRRGSCEDLRTFPSGDLSTQDGRFEKTPNGSLTGDRTHTPVSNDGHSSQRSEGGVNAETTNATAAYQHHTVGDSDEFSADTNPVSDLNAASDSIASLNTRRNSHLTAGDSSGDDRFDFDVTLEELVLVGTCGKGAGGFVQKAVHAPTGKMLAVKIVQMNVQSEVRKNILAELRALHGTESCPFIVKYRGAFFGDGSVSIVLEYMDGGSLSDVTRALGYIPENTLRVAAKQILLGLRYLHVDKKIVHRDIKPSNLLVNTHGEVKISDFGVSGQLANSVAKVSISHLPHSGD